MKLQSAWFISAFAFCAAAFPSISCAVQSAPVAAQRAMTQNKVVIQVSDSDPAKWNLALNNAKNVQQVLGKENVVIEIVAYGPGIDMLKMESEVANRIGETVAAGVKVMACEVTMKARHLTAQDLLPRVDFVPSGAVELIRRQQEGYAYIRP